MKLAEEPYKLFTGCTITHCRKNCNVIFHAKKKMKKTHTNKLTALRMYINGYDMTIYSDTLSVRSELFR